MQQALDQHQLDLFQERDLLQQFAQGAGKMAEDYRERFQSRNLVVPHQQQFTANEIARLENFAAPQTVPSVGTQFEAMTVSATSGGGIESISNPVQEAARGIDLRMAHQQLTTDNHLEQARQTLGRVSAESVAANEADMGAGMAVDAEAPGSEVLAALL